MKHIRLAAVCLGLLAGPAWGQWSDDFESATYTVGSTVIGKLGWAGWNGGSYTRALCQLDPVGGVSKVLREGYSTNIVHPFTGYTTGTWVFTTQMYIPSTAHHQNVASCTAYYYLMNKYVSGTTGAKGYGAQLRFNLGVDSALTTVDTVTDVADGGFAYVLYNQWVEVKVVINLDANYRATYYNGVLLGYGRWYDPSDANQAQEIAAVNLQVGAFTDYTATGLVYYDNMSLTAGTSSACPGLALEDFESYTLGSQLCGQCRWAGWDGGTFNATVVADPAATPTQGQVIMENAANDMVQYYWGYTSGAWVYTAKQYIPSTETAGFTSFILMDNYDSNASNTYSGWGATLTFDLANNMVYDIEAAVGIGPSILRDQWVEIRVEIDLDNNLRKTYYNGTLIGLCAWYDPGNTKTAKSIAAVDLWADDGGDPVYYDDLKIEAGTAIVVPPPAGLDLTTTGSVQARYLVNLGLSGGDSVETLTWWPTGVVEFASAGGNQNAWWRLNDGRSRGDMVTWAGSNPDYFGYKFKLPATVTSIVWHNFVRKDGGTFAAPPEVQYLDAPNGTWTTHADVTWDQPYNTVYNYGVDPNNITNGARRYVITLNSPPTGIWGLRLYGNPSPGADDDGTAIEGTGFVDVTEMTLYGNLEVGALDLSNNLALASKGGVPVASYWHYSTDAQKARTNDGLFNASNDTYGWVSPTGEDYVGVTWPTVQSNVTAVGVVFAGFRDGGYLGTPGMCNDTPSCRIEYTTDGTTWLPVTNLDKGRYPELATKLQSLQWGPDAGFLFRFDPVSNVTGMRIIGQALGDVGGGGGTGFFGWFEFEVFANTTGEPQAAQ